MSRSYRSIILALGLILGGIEQPTEQAQARTESQQAKNAGGVAAPPSEPPEPAYRPYPERYSDSCYNAQPHDAADLCAQWRSALAAEKAAQDAHVATVAAIIGTVLSFATVVGLIITIWQTNGALAEARRGNRLNLLFEKRVRRENRRADADQKLALQIASANAEATAQLVRHNQETAKIDLRAYVDYFDTINQGPVVKWIDGQTKDETDKCIVEIWIKNFGKTPAVNIETAYDASISEGPIIDLPFPEMMFNQDSQIAPGGAHILFIEFDEPSVSRFDIINEINVMHIFVDVRYKDIFGAQHGFRLRLESFGSIFSEGKVGAVTTEHW